MIFNFKCISTRYAYKQNESVKRGFERHSKKREGSIFYEWMKVSASFTANVEFRTHKRHSKNLQTSVRLVGSLLLMSLSTICKSDLLRTSQGLTVINNNTPFIRSSFLNTTVSSSHLPYRIWCLSRFYLGKSLMQIQIPKVIIQTARIVAFA